MGFCVELALPSPKSHVQFVISPVDASVKATSKGLFPPVGLAVKPATGGGGGLFTVISPGSVKESLPTVPDTSNETVYVPVDEYMCPGCCLVLVMPIIGNLLEERR